MIIFLGLKGLEPSTLCLGNISSNTTELQAFFNKRIIHSFIKKLSTLNFNCCSTDFIS